MISNDFDDTLVSPQSLNLGILYEIQFHLNERLWTAYSSLFFVEIVFDNFFAYFEWYFSDNIIILVLNAPAIVVDSSLFFVEIVFDNFFAYLRWYFSDNIIILVLNAPAIGVDTMFDVISTK